MAHSKDFRNYPAHWSKLAEKLASGMESVGYSATRKQAEYDRAVFYAFRAAAKRAEDSDREAGMIMLGLNGARFIITPARSKDSTNEDRVRVDILAWTTQGAHPLEEALANVEEYRG